MFRRGKRSPTATAVRASRNKGLVSSDDGGRVHRNEEKVDLDSPNKGERVALRQVVFVGLH